MLGARPGSVVVTLFAGQPEGAAKHARTDWDRAAGFGPGDDVMAARRAEDAAALALLGARPVWLDLLDAQYGGDASAEAFLGGEEQLLALDLLSAGWRLAYAPRLCARHDPSPLRDTEERRRLLRRNAARVAWLRRPWRRALAITRAQLCECRSPGEVSHLVAGIAGALPWILRERRPIDPEIERAIQLVEIAELEGTPRTPA